jgi:hypothetical protein
LFRAFYQYCGFLLALNVVQTCGCMLVLMGAASGLCMANLAEYMYLAWLTPLVYFAFLRGFFGVAQSNMLFAYKAQVRPRSK